MARPAARFQPGRKLVRCLAPGVGPRCRRHGFLLHHNNRRQGWNLLLICGCLCLLGQAWHGSPNASAKIADHQRGFLQRLLPASRRRVEDNSQPSGSAAEKLRARCTREQLMITTPYSNLLLKVSPHRRQRAVPSSFMLYTPQYSMYETVTRQAACSASLAVAHMQLSVRCTVNAEEMSKRRVP